MGPTRRFCGPTRWNWREIIVCERVECCLGWDMQGWMQNLIKIVDTSGVRIMLKFNRVARRQACGAVHTENTRKARGRSLYQNWAGAIRHFRSAS